MGELKPCPFCGSKYTQVRYMGGKWQGPSAFSSGYRGECCGCYAVTAAYDTEAEAIDAWNTRVERTCTNELRPDEGRRNFFKCSACGCTVTDCEDYCVNVYTSDGAVGWSYCPHCGARVIAP